MNEHSKTTSRSEEHRPQSPMRETVSDTSDDQIAAMTRNVGKGLVDYAKKNPVVVLGAAAGAGFVLGSALGSKVGRIVLTVVAGYAVQSMIGEHGVQKLVTGGVDQILKARAAR